VYQVRVLDETRIQQQGAQQLGDLLQVELGTYLYQDPVLGQSVQLQGLSGEHVKILVDGVPVVGRLGGDLDLSQLPLQEVVRIEVIEGPMSVEYGTNALAGVINLITRRSSPAPLRVSLQAYEANVGPGHSVYDGFHNYRGSLALQRGKHRWNLQAGRDFFGGSFGEKDQRWKQWSPKVQHFGSAGYQWQGKSWQVQGTSRLFEESLVRKDSGAGAYRPQARDAYFTTRRQQHQLDTRWQINDQLSWQGVWAYSTFRRNSETHLVDLISLKDSLLPSESAEERLRHGMARGSFGYQFSALPLSLQMGYDLNREELRGARIENEIQLADDLATFASAEYRPNAKLSLRPGLRVAYHNRYNAPLTPSFHLKFYPGYEWTLRASYARGFRAPSLKELFLDFVDINHDLQGNPNLQAETADHFQGQVQWQQLSERQLWQVEGQFFYNDIRQKIELAATGNSAVSYTYLNLDRLKTFGGRGEVKWQRNAFQSTLGIGVLGKDQRQLLEVANVRPVVFSLQSSAQLRYEWAKIGLLARLFYRFTGPVEGYANLGDAEQPEWIATRIPAFHWADVSVQKDWKGKQFQTTLGIKNLFNVTTLAATGVPSAHSGSGNASIGLGRQVFVQLNYLLETK
jgi:outer membrane receptor for ferrienterochelin and colicins